MKQEYQPEDNGLLATEKAVKLLKVSVSTLYHWRKEGKIKARRIERRLYYKREDIKRTMQQN